MYSLPQINHIRGKEGILLILKLSICAACLYYIFSHVGQSSADLPWHAWVANPRYLWALFAVLLLLPANWLLEVLKWRYCIRPIIHASRSFAAAAVLRGLALNWLIPFTMGDFMGRMMGIPKSRHSVKALLVSRTYSILVTAFIGVPSIFYLYAADYLWLCLLLIGLAALACYFLISRDSLYSPLEHGTIAALTLVRYGVFFLQLLLLLYVVLPHVPTAILGAGVGAVFLIRSVVPSVLGALGVREAAIVFIFSPFVAEVTPLLIASFSLWTINIILPSLVGMVPLLAYRFKPAL